LKKKERKLFVEMKKKRAGMNKKKSCDFRIGDEKWRT
jgi:hypothetical protein